jgi:hypothetical protein
MGQIQSYLWDSGSIKLMTGYSAFQRSHWNKRMREEAKVTKMANQEDRVFNACVRNINKSIERGECSAICFDLDGWHIKHLQKNGYKVENEDEDDNYSHRDVRFVRWDKAPVWDGKSWNGK